MQTIRPGEPYCTIYNEVTNTTTSKKLKGTEPVIVDYVAADVKNKKHLEKVLVFFFFLVSILYLGYICYHVYDQLSRGNPSLEFGPFSRYVYVSFIGRL